MLSVTAVPTLKGWKFRGPARAIPPRHLIVQELQRLQPTARVVLGLGAVGAQHPLAVAVEPAPELTPVVLEVEEHHIRRSWPSCARSPGSSFQVYPLAGRGTPARESICRLKPRSWVASIIGRKGSFPFQLHPSTTAGDSSPLTRPHSRLLFSSALRSTTPPISRSSAAWALKEPAVEVGGRPSCQGGLDLLHRQGRPALADLDRDPAGVTGHEVVQTGFDPVAQAVVRGSHRPVEEGRRGRRRGLGRRRAPSTAGGEGPEPAPARRAPLRRSPPARQTHPASRLIRPRRLHLATAHLRPSSSSSCPWGHSRSTPRACSRCPSSRANASAAPRRREAVRDQGLDAHLTLGDGGDRAAPSDPPRTRRGGSPRSGACPSSGRRPGAGGPRGRARSGAPCPSGPDHLQGAWRTRPRPGGPPTQSTTTSAPRPPVRRRTSATASAPPACTAASAPSSREQAHAQLQRVHGQHPPHPPRPVRLHHQVAHQPLARGRPRCPCRPGPAGDGPGQAGPQRGPGRGRRAR